MKLTLFNLWALRSDLQEGAYAYGFCCLINAPWNLIRHTYMFLPAAVVVTVSVDKR